MKITPTIFMFSVVLRFNHQKKKNFGTFGLLNMQVYFAVKYVQNLYKNLYKSPLKKSVQKSVKKSVKICTNVCQILCTKSVQKCTLALAALVTDQTAEFQNSLWPPDNSWQKSLCRQRKCMSRMMNNVWLSWIGDPIIWEHSSYVEQRTVVTEYTLKMQVGANLQ